MECSPDEVPVMIICRIEVAGRPQFGRVEGERVALMEGNPFGDFRMTGASVPRAGVKYLPPTIPFTFFAAGVNYRAHILEAQARNSPVAKFPTPPDTGYRANNALIGHDEEIVQPKDHHRVLR